MQRSLLFVLSFFIASLAHGFDPKAAAILAETPQWNKLLYFVDGRDASGVISDEFFLSNDQKKDPRLELLATIEAFRAPAGENKNSHAVCRFPARYLFLKKNTTFESPISPVDCPFYQRWLGEKPIESISLIFATGYLGNPASYYGHMLMKFNRKGSVNENMYLLDDSINFGALDTEEDHVLLYVFKGLLGGYDAAFSGQDFYRHNLVYGETQLRDLWEYNLNLSDFQTELIVAHTWEMLPQKFQYFFLKENCAYRIANVMELVLEEEELVSKKTPFAIPYSIFDRLNQIDQQGTPLVSDIQYIPSRHQVLANKLTQLDADERRIVRFLIGNNLNFKESGYVTLDETRKAAIVEVLLDYYQYMLVKSSHAEVYTRSKNKVLIERLRLPAHLVNWDPAIGSPPHLGNRPSALRIGYLHQKSRDAVTLNYRAAYYDFLSLDEARLKNSELITFDLELAIVDGEVELNDLTLLDIHNLNLSTTGLPDDGGFAWQFDLGYRDLAIGCDDCKTTQLKTGVGLGTELGNFAIYGMVNGRAHGSWQLTGNYSAQFEAGLIWNLSRSLKIYSSYSKSRYKEKSNIRDERFWLSARILESKSWDLRFSVGKEVETEQNFQLSYYF